MSTGSDLERAILSAAKHYQAVDKCELQKQHTPRLHDGTYMGKASVDFKGWANPGRQPYFVEAKATSDGLIEFRDVGDGIREKQLTAMRDAVWRSIRMVLIADFVPEGEVYVIDVKHVVEFADAPWRKSLSFRWCRAFGERAKVSVERGHRRIWFLDTSPSELQATAYLAVAEERARAEGKTIELFPVELLPSQKRLDRFAARPAPGTPEHKQYVIGLADQGLRRAMRSGSRPVPKWNPKRKGMR